MVVCNVLAVVTDAAMGEANPYRLQSRRFRSSRVHGR
jgi:hypothetical protein